MIAKRLTIESCRESLADTVDERLQSRVPFDLRVKSVKVTATSGNKVSTAYPDARDHSIDSIEVPLASLLLRFQLGNLMRSLECELCFMNTESGTYSPQAAFVLINYMAVHGEVSIKLIAEVIHFRLNFCNRQCFLVFLKLGMRQVSHNVSIVAHHEFKASTDVIRNGFEVLLRPFLKRSQCGFGGIGSFFLYKNGGALSRSLPAGVFSKQRLLCFTSSVARIVFMSCLLFSSRSF